MAHLITIAGASNIKSHTITTNSNNHPSQPVIISSNNGSNNQYSTTTISQSLMPHHHHHHHHQHTRDATSLLPQQQQSHLHQYHLPVVTSSIRAACPPTATTTTTTTTIYTAPDPLDGGARFNHHHSRHVQGINQNNTSNNGNTNNGQIVVDVVNVVVSPPLYHEIPGTVPAYQGRSSGPPPSYDDVINPNAPPPSYQSLFGQVREARKSSSVLMDLLRQLFLILISTLGCTIIIGFIILIPITMIVIGVIYINDCKAENIPIFLVIGGITWITKNVLNCYNQFKKEASSTIRSTSSAPSSSASNSANSGNRTIVARPSSTSSSSASNSTSSASRTIGARSSSSPVITDHRHLDRNNNYDHFIERGEHRSGSNAELNHDGRISTHIRNSRSLPPSSLRSFKYESLLNIFLIGWFVASCIIVYRIYEPEYENTISSRYCNRTVYLYAFWLFSSTFIMFAVFLSCMCCLMLSSVIASHQEDGAS